MTMTVTMTTAASEKIFGNRFIVFRAIVLQSAVYLNLYKYYIYKPPRLPPSPFPLPVTLNSRRLAFFPSASVRQR